MLLTTFNSYLLEKLLIMRGYTITQYLLIVCTRFKQRGFVYVVKKIFSKARNKIARTIVTTSSGSASVMAEVLYKRK